MTSTVRREEKVDTVEGRRGGKESRARQRRSMVTTGGNVEKKARDKSVFESRMLVMGGYTMKEHDHSRDLDGGGGRGEGEGGGGGGGGGGEGGGGPSYILHAASHVHSINFHSWASVGC